MGKGFVITSAVCGVILVLAGNITLPRSSHGSGITATTEFYLTVQDKITGRYDMGNGFSRSSDNKNDVTYNKEPVKNCDALLKVWRPEGLPDSVPVTCKPFKADGVDAFGVKEYDPGFVQVNEKNGVQSKPRIYLASNAPLVDIILGYEMNAYAAKTALVSADKQKSFLKSGFPKKVSRKGVWVSGEGRESWNATVGLDTRDKTFRDDVAKEAVSCFSTFHQAFYRKEGSSKGSSTSRLNCDSVEKLLKVDN